MKRFWMTKLARWTIAAAIGLTGCATLQRAQAPDTEQVLAAAGFRIQLADPAGQPIEATPPYRVVSRTRDGAIEYVYADPTNCKCLYVGGAKEYAEYRRLARERRMALDRAMSEQNWPTWGPWGYW